MSNPQRPDRVLVVDDSAFMRMMVSQILRDAGFEVVGACRDGQDALAAVESLSPDAITLDVQMPNMDGVEFLRQLMAKRPTPVVMLSSETAQGAEITITCLMLGAFDAVRKPSGSISLDIEKAGAEIASKVRAAADLGRRGFQPRLASPAAKLKPFLAATLPPERPGLSARDRIVVIASSTGGPAALARVIPHLPRDFEAPVLLVQHLPVGMTDMFALRLNEASALSVRQARPGDTPRAGEVLVAPGGCHMQLDKSGHIELTKDPPMWGVRPAADVLFQSVASTRGADAVAVVLTGMGRDGAMGSKRIRDAGGHCIAQDERTSVVYGMPRACVEAGARPEVRALDDISAAIVAAVAGMSKQNGKSRHARCA